MAVVQDLAAADSPSSDTASAAADTASSSNLLGDLQSSLTILSDNTTFMWALFAAALVGGSVAGRILAWLLRRLGANSQDDHFRTYLLHALSAPLTLAGTVVGIDVGINFLVLPEGMQSGIEQMLLFLYIVSVFWFLISLAGYIDVVVRRRSDKTGGDYGQHLGPAIRKVMRIFLVILAVMVVVDMVFLQDIGAWLAGFGVAGLAISLAAQDSFKSFFGAITIFADKPFKVGQRIVFSGHDGIVEEIGFRSVRIRTLVGHLVTVPNSAIVNDAVQNIGERPYIRRLFTVNVTYDTPPEKMQEAVDIITGILESDDLGAPIHPVINGDELPPRVYFSDLSSYSLDIMVIYWYTPPAYWDFMTHAHQVNMRILEQFNAAGIDFAFPSQTLYHASDDDRGLRVMVDQQGKQADAQG